MQLKTSKGTLVEVADQSFAGGGQATIHTVIAPLYPKQYVAKIFKEDNGQPNGTGKPSSKMMQLEQKIQFMITNNPFRHTQQKITEAFAWPEDMLYDHNGQFRGYLLPFISDSIEAVSIILGKPLKPDWQRFGIKHSNSYNIRTKLCYNIAQALSVLHESGFYTMVDMKPCNIMLKQNGFVSMIDLDSIQISQNRHVLHFANVHTDEYAPPEHHQNKVNYTKQYIDPNWDVFSYAVLAYKFLFNIHPFGGISHKTQHQLHTQEEFIAGGYFAHGKYAKELDCAPPHSNYHRLLSDPLKDLFPRTFVDGHDDPQNRPKASEWRDAFLHEIGCNKNKKITAGHNQPVSQPVRTAVKQVMATQGTVLSPQKPNKPVFLIPPQPVKLARQGCSIKATLSLNHIGQKLNTHQKLNSINTPLARVGTSPMQTTTPIRRNGIRLKPKHSEIQIKNTIKLLNP